MPCQTLSATCATGKLDGSGDPFECTLDFQALDPAKLNFDCGDATDGGGNLICENSECCALGTGEPRGLRSFLLAGYWNQA